MVCSLASLLPKRFLTYIIGQIIFCNFSQLFAIFGDFNTYIWIQNDLCFIVSDLTYISIY